MKKLLLSMALLGVTLCKTVQIAPHLQKNLNRITLNPSLQIHKKGTSLVGQLQQTAQKPRCKNLCRKFQVTAFSVPTCRDGNSNGSIAIGIAGGTPPFTLGGDFEGTTSVFFGLVEDIPDGTYTLKVIDSNGCSSQQEVTVTNSCPTKNCQNFKLFARSIPVSICSNNIFGGIIVVGVEGATGPVEFSFFKNNVFVGSDTVPLSDLPTLFNPFDNGTYIVEARDTGSEGCNPQTSQVIINNTCPLIPQCASPLVYCCTK